MKEGRKPEYPEKTPGDELQISFTTVMKLFTILHCIYKSYHTLFTSSYQNVFIQVTKDMFTHHNTVSTHIIKIHSLQAPKTSFMPVIKPYSIQSPKIAFTTPKTLYSLQSLHLNHSSHHTVFTPVTKLYSLQIVY